MLRVGLTGGIAVGKSYVSALLRELGCHVFDADDIARAVVQPGMPALNDIVAAFGPDVLAADGTLDRAKLGRLVFADAEARSRLNAIVHPRVHAEQDRLLREVEARDPHGIAVVDAALLIESGGYRRFDVVVVVWCRPEIQLARLMARNGLSREEAAQRIAAQMPSEEKRRYADFEIDTSEGFEPTRQQVLAMHTALRARATAC
ncbi:dephospho-CoA kinase [Chloracidobacterium thermophilum]|uniref:dephospho-CoA kinase n=1 Tax=Chloracidobacterium thermophilum TaxID=458033 RepID=UPI00073863D5|nr:dephospho-CoA kinase [Chloracidobacterium thermophilum]